MTANAAADNGVRCTDESDKTRVSHLEFMFQKMELETQEKYEYLQIEFVSSIMILPQVHLRKPCYDFYFL